MRISAPPYYVVSGFGALSLVTACSGENTKMFGYPTVAQKEQARLSVQSIEPRLFEPPSVLPPALQELTPSRSSVQRFISAEVRAPGGPHAFISDLKHDAVYIL